MVLDIHLVFATSKMEIRQRLVNHKSVVWQFIVGSLLIGMVLGLRLLVSAPKPAVAEYTPTYLRKPFPMDFTLPTLQGDSTRLSSLHGKVILLNFWATWCYPCRTELPSMQALFKRYQSQSFLILAVASDTRGEETVAPFADQLGITFPVLLDSKDVIGQRLQIPGIPTSYVLDKQGRIVSIEVGGRNWNSPAMHRLIDSLLTENDLDASLDR